MKIVCIIEARMSSTRLPGKVLMEAAGQSFIEHIVKRLKVVKLIDEIVVATTNNSKDDDIVRLAKSQKYKYYRGSEEDVMSRVLEASEMVHGDIIVEITGDCPMIDPCIVEQIINIYLKNDVDYVSNVKHRSYPDGMDVQVFSYEVLKKSFLMTNDSKDREHVTLHIRNNPNLFSTINIIAPPELFWPDLGLTLDESSDFIFIKKIIENLYDKNPCFNCGEIIKFLKNNKELLKINNKVKRKGVE